ncbi:MAG: beta-ketoacyl-ACP synthase II [bacterium]|nr:beta-ketoacyl-ACP synthase II [bacterium]
MNTKHRVVVTGLGAITPLGNTFEEFWDGLIKGKSGLDRVTHFPVDDYSSKIAGEVKGFDPGTYLETKDIKRTAKFTQFALAAATQAIEDAGLDLDTEDRDRIGVIVGSGIGGLDVIEQQHTVLLNRGPRRISPFFIPMEIINMAAGMISIYFGLKGPNSAVVTACATGTTAIGDAFRLIQLGEAEVMIAGGSEAALTPLGLAGFCAAKALSTRNDDPTGASRPFDAGRDGFVMGEGAGIVVLESLEHANLRGANIYAEVIGYASCGDAYHITAPAPGGEGAARAIKATLNDAGLEPQDVNYINAHGTSTVLNDKFETMAIKTVFGRQAYSLAMSSTKSMTGHLLGAAGGVEFIAAVLTVNRGIIPPTINYETPDPECDLDYVPNEAREAKVNVALSNTFGFGGQNVILAVKRYK